MKEKLSLVLLIPLIIFFGLGYIYNVVWMLDHWSAISTGLKFLNVSGVFIPPLGGFLGVIHFF
jgi:hypothetical protein